MPRNSLTDQNDLKGRHGRGFFTARNRVWRAFWQLTWLCLARWTPPPFHRWRCFLLRLFGAEIGRGARVYASVIVWDPRNLQMGDYSVLGPNCNCYNQGMIVLENYASVSQFTHLVTGTHDFNSKSFNLYTRPIRVCAEAWIALGGYVGPGVTIGEGAVLGAMSVTRQDLEPWMVYAGNPAVCVSKRKNFNI